jgi:tetratricopeptide (TPR) repeat protein
MMLDLGVVLMSSGRLDEAAEIFRRVIKLDDSKASFMAMSNLAYILMERGDLGIAEETFRTILASDVSELHGPAHLGLSQIYEDTDRPVEADSERALAASGDSAAEVLDALERAARILEEEPPLDT